MGWQVYVKFSGSRIRFPSQIVFWLKKIQIISPYSQIFFFNFVLKKKSGVNPFRQVSLASHVILNQERKVVFVTEEVGARLRWSQFTEKGRGFLLISYENNVELVVLGLFLKLVISSFLLKFELFCICFIVYEYGRFHFWCVIWNVWLISLMIVFFYLSFLDSDCSIF